MPRQLLSNLFIEMRKEKGMSLQQLSDACEAVFSRKFIHDIEKGRWLPTEQRLVAFCEKLKLNKEEYLTALNFSRIEKEKNKWQIWKSEKL